MEINRKFVEDLFPKTQKEVARQWRERKTVLAKAEQKQTEFELLIAKMRKIKYAKQVLKAIWKAQESVNGNLVPLVESVLILDRDLTQEEKKLRQTLWAVDVLIVAKDAADFDAIQEFAKTAAGRAPLSKYGIAATIDILAVSNISSYRRVQQLPAEARLSVYRIAPDHYSTADISKTDWLQSLNMAARPSHSTKVMPPVLSLIQISKADLDRFSSVSPRYLT
jgi:hypothetical protein